MDILKTAREIGFFELGQNLMNIQKSSSLVWRIEERMPLPDDDFLNILSDIPRRMKALGKAKCFFLTPEIALIERLSSSDGITDAAIAIPSDMEKESVERMRNNIPRNINVSLLPEPGFPNAFLPCNGVIFVCGYMAGNHQMVLPETYRMINHYWGFTGKKIFIPYVTRTASVKYYDWLETTSDFTMIWSCENA